MKRRLTTALIVAMGLGIGAGALCNAFVADPAWLKTIIDIFHLGSDLFLRLIKMVIAPLVLTTLISGIAQLGDASAIGRTGLKAFAWFVPASLISLLLGTAAALVLQPGAGLAFPAAPSAAVPLESGALTASSFLAHVVPTSIMKAMTDNEVLQIVVFSMFAGIAIAALGKAARLVQAVLSAAAAIMMRITDYVMLFAPLGVFAAVAAAVASHGLGIIGVYAALVADFYLALLLLFGAIVGAGYVLLGRTLLPVLRAAREPALIAFSSASSEAAYPRLLESLEGLGIPNRVASFVLPLGYSFNLDGSMMYCTFAAIFIAQAYGISLTAADIAAMVALLLVLSKGTANVPRASLVVLASALPYFHLPQAGLFMILAVDQFLDMGRTGINVVGNAVATAVVARWEGVTLSRH